MATTTNTSAIDFSAIKIGMYNDKLQLFGLSSSFDTKTMLDAELQAMQARQVPYTNQITTNTDMISKWAAFKSNMGGLLDAANALKTANLTNQKVTAVGTGATFQASNGAISADYNMTIDHIATKDKVMSDGMGDPTAQLNQQGDVLINGKTLSVQTTTSLNDIASAINSDTGYGADAAIIGGHLILTSKNTGAASAITLSESGTTVLQSLGFTNSSNVIKNHLQAASDSAYTINTIALTSSSNTITDAISGITINLTAPSSSLNFSVQRDTQSLQDKVQTFVNMYNKTIAYINTSTAKGSALQTERVPRDMKRMLSDALQQTGTSSGVLMYQLGIQTDSVLKDGSIKFDATKLNAQLELDSKNVADFFTGDKGIGGFLSGKMSGTGNFMDRIDSEVTGLTTRNASINKKLDGDKLSFSKHRDMLLNKYAGFEVMMGQLNMQSQMIAATLGF
jgi:flagellar hook-associated protein 2